MLKKTGIFIVLSLLTFYSCKNHYSVVNSQATHQSLKNNSSSFKFDTLISPYKAQLNSEMTKELVMSEGDLTKDGAETTLGNFICDAMKWAFDSIMGLKSEGGIVLMNRGGMRANINKGMVTVNSIFEVMPFDNELEYVIIDGKEFGDVLKRVVEKKHAFYGMAIKVEKNGEFIATMAGKKVVEDSNYPMLCADFVVSGGDGFTFGKKLIQEKKLGLTIRDAIINYCRHLKFSKKTITPYLDGRFEISK
jgi:2',3'-cyclic-nucleotide 2'-phosphodiesterase (5'-nucleotidase family)